MTSNLGSEYLVNLREGEDTKTVEKEVMSVVRGHFRPEFLNRVDEIILFHRLRREDISEIVDIQLERLNRLLEDRKIGLSLDPKARQWLAEKGYDPAYGARPLKRVIQKWCRTRWRRCCSLARSATARRSSSAPRAADDQRQGGRRRIRRFFESQVAVGRAVSED